jgi:hypothetical protein
MKEGVATTGQLRRSLVASKRGGPTSCVVCCFGSEVVEVRKGVEGAAVVMLVVVVVVVLLLLLLLLGLLVPW